jgi:hypothetical protein
MPMKYNPAPMPVEDLRALLGYDPDTGRFWWKVDGRGCGGNVRIGKSAGFLHHNRYIVIKIGGTDYGAHRLAWYLVHETWPPADMDYKNLIKSDNRIVNLRPATRAQNSANKRGFGAASGYRGVTPSKKRWKARIRINSRDKYLGLFKTPEEAHAAVCTAIQRTRGEFGRTD